MNDQQTSEMNLLRAAYAAFNARDITAALGLMTPNVSWPRAFKGGFVRGHSEVSAYWTEQWSEINPHVEPVTFDFGDAGRIFVSVHQVVRDLTGSIVADDQVVHCFTVVHGLIDSMDVGPEPATIIA